MKKEAVKNIEPVVKKELDAITIGTLKETTKKTPIGALILIVILVAFAFMLPEINTWLKKQNTQVIGGQVTPEVKPQAEEEETDDKVYYPVNSTTVIKVNDLTFNKFNLSVQTLSFTITNAGKTYNFNDQKVFVEIYDQNKTLLERAMVDQDINLKKGSREVGVFFNNDMTKAAFMSVRHIDETLYPPVNITNNELVCTKGTEKLTFSFTNDELSTMIEQEKVVKNSKSYTSYLNFMRKSMAGYQNINGISVNEQEETDAIIFTVTIDTAVAPSNELKFANKTKPAVINFELEASGYDCN